MFILFSGKVTNVSGTVYDFQNPTKLSDILDNLPNKDGLHMAYVLPGKMGDKKTVAKYVSMLIVFNLRFLCILLYNVSLIFLQKKLSV